MRTASLTGATSSRSQPGRHVIAPLSRRAGLVVAGVAGVIGVGASYGGVRLLVDAEALGVKESWLEGTLFRDYRVPGVVLLTVVGGGMLVTALAALRRSRYAGLGALAMGVALIVWGVVETLTIGYQGTGQLVLLAVFVVAPALPLLLIGWRARVTPASPAERDDLSEQYSPCEAHAADGVTAARRPEVRAAAARPPEASTAETQSRLDQGTARRLSSPGPTRRPGRTSLPARRSCSVVASPARCPRASRERDRPAGGEPCRRRGRCA
jgi:hypothetical protein